MDILKQSTADAEAAPTKSANALPVIAGPFPVGNIGTVAVVEREMGGSKYRYAEYRNASGSAPKRIPLAAVPALYAALSEDSDEEE